MFSYYRYKHSLCTDGGPTAYTGHRVHPATVGVHSFQPLGSCISGQDFHQHYHSALHRIYWWPCVPLSWAGHWGLFSTMDLVRIQWWTDWTNESGESGYTQFCGPFPGNTYATHALQVMRLVVNISLVPSPPPPAFLACSMKSRGKAWKNLSHDACCCWHHLAYT